LEKANELNHLAGADSGIELVLGDYRQLPFADNSADGVYALESSSRLFTSWRLWAEGREEWVGSVKTFSAKLEDRGEFVKCKNREQTKRGFAGLRVKAGGRGRKGVCRASKELNARTADGFFGPAGARRAVPSAAGRIRTAQYVWGA
jgi:hypothetical protein